MPAYSEAVYPNLPNALNQIPMFGWSVNRDEISLQNRDQLMELGNYKEARFNRPIKIKIMKPKIPVGAFQQGTGTYNGGIMMSGQWQRTQEPSIVYYGLKTTLYNVGNGQSVPYTVRAKHYWTFKGIQ